MAQALAKMPMLAPETARILEGSLSAEAVHTRLSAISILSEHQELMRPLIPEFIKLQKSDPSPEVRNAVEQALLKKDGPPRHAAGPGWWWLIGGMGLAATAGWFGRDFLQRVA